MTASDLTQAASLWWSVIAVAAMKSTIILVLAALIAGMMRRHTPAARFQIWLGGLLAAAALPLVSAAAPELPWLPSWFATVFGQMDGVAGGTRLGGNAFDMLGVVLMASWCLGFAWHAGRATIAAALLGQMAWSSRRVGDRHRLARLSRQLQHRLGVSGTVHIHLASADARPMAWGVWQARLLLPETAETWSRTRAEAVLLHELEHIRRRDALAQLAEQLICAVYWFHPLVWVASGQLRWEREAACDDAVLRAGVLPTDYAESLLALSHPNSRVWRAPSLAAPMAETAALTRRVREILSATRIRRPLPLTATMLTAAGFALVLGLLSALAPAPARERLVDSPTRHHAEGDPSASSFESRLATVELDAPVGAPLQESSSPSGDRAAFAARIGRAPIFPRARSPLDRSPLDRNPLDRNPLWRSDSQWLMVETNTEPASDASRMAWPSEPTSPNSELTLEANDPELLRRNPSLRRAPTDTHGRVSQVGTSFRKLPVPL